MSMNENYIEKPEGKPVKTFGANYSEIIKVFNSKTGKSKEPSYPTVEEIIDRV